MNNTINGVMVEELTLEEKIMVELNERRELMIIAIEGELMQEDINMELVADYEEILASIEWEIINLLNTLGGE